MNLCAIFFWNFFGKCFGISSLSFSGIFFANFCNIFNILVKKSLHQEFRLQLQWFFFQTISSWMSSAFFFKSLRDNHRQFLWKFRRQMSMRFFREFLWKILRQLFQIPEAILSEIALEVSSTIPSVFFSRSPSTVPLRISLTLSLKKNCSEVFLNS